MNEREVGVAAGDAHLTFDSHAPSRYWLQYTTDLNSGVWSNTGYLMLGTGEEMTTTGGVLSMLRRSGAAEALLSARSLAVPPIT